MKWTGLDVYLTAEMMGYAPRIFIEAPLMALTDLSVGKIAQRLGGSFHMAIVLSMTNWFMYYCGIRTYSNSIEGSLLTIALSKWPLNKAEASKFDLAFPLFLAALSIVIRTSSVVSWLYLGICYALFDVGLTNKQLYQTIAVRVLPVGLVVLGASIVLDRIFYGRFVFVPYQFFDFNILRDIASSYGVHATYWYMLECWPAILGIQLPLFAFGVYTSWVEKSSVYCGQRFRLIGLIFFVLCVLSTSPHKEMRFAFPVLPAGIVVSSIGLNHPTTVKRRPHLVWIAIILGGLIPALYLSLYHQRAAIDLVLHLSANAEGKVDMLLPCHATPLYAFSHPVHSKITEYSFLDCSPHQKELEFVPNLNTSFAYNGVSESKIFTQDPLRFTSERYSRLKPDEMPNVIVTGTMFLSGVESGLKQVQASQAQQVGSNQQIQSYTVCARFGYTRDSDVGEELLVLCRTV